MPQTQSKHIRRNAQNVSKSRLPSVEYAEKKEKSGHKRTKSTETINFKQTSENVVSNFLITSNKNAENANRKSCLLNKKEAGDNLRICPNSQISSKSLIANKNYIISLQSNESTASDHSNQLISGNLACSNNSLIEENTDLAVNITNKNPLLASDHSPTYSNRKLLKLTSNINSITLDPNRIRIKKKSIFQHKQVTRRWKETNFTYEFVRNMKKSCDANIKFKKRLSKKKVRENITDEADPVQVNELQTDSLSPFEKKMEKGGRKPKNDQPRNLMLTNSSFPSSESEISRVKKLASFWEGKLVRSHSKSEKTLFESSCVTKNKKEYNEEGKENQVVLDKHKFKEILLTVTRLQKLLENISDLSEIENEHELDLLEPLTKSMSSQLKINNYGKVIAIANQFQAPLVRANHKVGEELQTNINRSDYFNVSPYCINKGMKHNQVNIQEISKNIAFIAINAFREAGVDKNEFFREITKQINLIEKKPPENVVRDLSRPVESTLQLRRIYTSLQFKPIIVILITITIVLLILVYNELLDWRLYYYRKIVINL